MDAREGQGGETSGRYIDHRKATGRSEVRAGLPVILPCKETGAERHRLFVAIRKRFSSGSGVGARAPTPITVQHASQNVELCHS